MSDTPMPSWRTRPDEAGISGRMLLVAGGLLGGVVVLGLVGWGVSRLGPRAVPVVEADPSPLKVRPDAPGGLEVPNQDERIFDRPTERRAEPLVPAARLVPQRPEQPMTDRPPPAAAPAPQARPEPAPAPAPARPAPAPAAAGRWSIQLGALASEAAARATWERMAHQVPALHGHQPAISRLERDGQVPLWRLRMAGLADGAAARALCGQVRAKGGGCLPVAP